MTSRVPFRIATLAGLLLLLESPVLWADILPGSTYPEQVGKALKQEQPLPAQGVLPPVVAPVERTESPLSAQAKKITFELNGVILQGNTVYSTEELSKIYKDKLHTQMTVADLFGIVQAITNYYRNNGYIISRAILPPQHVKGGTVTIQIIEGYIGEVKVEGDPKKAKLAVQRFGDKIKACRPLDVNKMERYLLLANELPATQVRAVLAPSKSKTGAADLSLVTQNKPVTAYGSYDNYGTRYIGPQQMTANLSFNSFMTSGDSLQVTETKTPRGAELTYTDVNYGVPIDAEGKRLLLGATNVHTRPQFVLAQTKIDGTNQNYYTTVQFPVMRSRTRSLTLRTSFNYLNSAVTTFGLPLYNDHVRSLDLGLTYNFSDHWYGINMINLDLRQGLPIFGYTKDTNPETAETSRPGGNANYTKVGLQASRLQAIRGPVSLYGFITGQYAFVPLLASEQYTFGGSQIGRGYDVAEFIGDRGVAASLELRYDVGVNRFFLQNLQFYTFYDIGAVWNMIQTGGTPTKNSGASTGVGVRFFGTKYISGNLMWTQVLTKQVATEEILGEGRRPRVFFSIVANFN